MRSSLLNLHQSSNDSNFFENKVILSCFYSFSAQTFFVIVKQLLELGVHGMLLEIALFSRHFETRHGRRVECCVNLLQAAKVVHFIKVAGYVEYPKYHGRSLLQVGRVHDALGVPVGELVREIDELHDVGREAKLVGELGACPAQADQLALLDGAKQFGLHQSDLTRNLKRMHGQQLVAVDALQVALEGRVLTLVDNDR